MNVVYAFGRCLTCWGSALRRVEVRDHLPQAFKNPCDHCGGDRLFAVTGQVIQTLSPAALRQIKGAQERKVRVQWEQLPLVPALMPVDAPPPSPGATTQYHKPSLATHDAGPAKLSPRSAKS